MATTPKLQLRYREPFALTEEQFRALAAVTPGTRRTHLGILAHAHEYEQHRRDLKDGAPWLMYAHEELRFAATVWPEIAAEKHAEAVAEFDRMVAERSVAA